MFEENNKWSLIDKKNIKSQSNHFNFRSQLVGLTENLSLQKKYCLWFFIVSEFYKIQLIKHQSNFKMIDYLNLQIKCIISLIICTKIL